MIHGVARDAEYVVRAIHGQAPLARPAGAAAQRLPHAAA
jgi:hypothetical protein